MRCSKQRTKHTYVTHEGPFHRVIVTTTDTLSEMASNSNYALLGGLLAVAQNISYEVSLSLILISVEGFNL